MTNKETFLGEAARLLGPKGIEREESADLFLEYSLLPMISVKGGVAYAEFLRSAAAPALLRLLRGGIVAHKRRAASSEASATRRKGVAAGSEIASASNGK